MLDVTATVNPFETMAYAQAAAVLQDLAKLQEPTLSILGMEPASSPIYVMDTTQEIVVGTEEQVLRRFAKSNGLDFIGPLETRAEDGVVWEVALADGAGGNTVMFAGEDEETCKLMFMASLRDMAGDRVAPIGHWSDVHSAGALPDELDHLLAPKKEKPSQFVVCERLVLQPLPISRSVALEMADLSEKKVRRKAAYEQIGRPQGMGSLLDASAASGWNIPVLRDNDKRFANYHDILSALRLGLDVSDIAPWPADIAHRFLVAEELRKVMRGRGFSELTDIDESRRIKLRTSLPEFSPEITGDKPRAKEKPVQMTKPAWPPQELSEQRVVIALGRARLAYEDEPEWETVSIRNIHSCAGHWWVETAGPTERRKSSKASRKE